MMRSASARRAAAALLALAALAGCAARSAYRQGLQEGQRGNWDVAVARLTKAFDSDPENISYRIALENARSQASRMHHVEARKRLAADDLAGAVDSLEIASKYDPGNKSAADDLAIVRKKLREREDAKQQLAQFEAARQRARSQLPVPVLSPRSPVPISINFSDQSLEKVFETIGKLAGVNVLFDEQFRDKKVGVRLSGVTFQEALDQICLVNRLFYKVLDQNSIIVVPESPAKRRSYDEVLVQTFYLQNAEVNEAVTVIKQIAGVSKAQASPALGAITVVATPDKMAAIERVLAAHDKARGEVMVQVEILEVNRNNLKRYGLSLSNYEASATLSPTGAEGELASGFTNARAHLLSSLNVADFVVSIPSTLLAQFLQTESTVRILASPRLRAAEGKKTALKIGTEVPVPVTTFTATAVGNSTFSPATSFQYRNVGINLELEPKVNAGGEIFLGMTAEFSLLGEDRNVGTAAAPLVVPTFLTRNVTGTLRLKDGETSLIGGLLNQREADSFRGALGLRNVPLLNKLLGANSKTQDETEILISITPHLVRAPKVTEEDLRAFSFGTEEVARVPGARPLFGPELEPAPDTAPPAPAAAGPAPTPAPGPTPEARRRIGVQPRPTPANGAPPAAEEVAQSVRLAPSSPGARRDQPLELNLLLSAPAEVTAVEVVVRYDPQRLAGFEAVAGSLLTLDGTPVGVERHEEAGRLRARFVRQRPASGAGALVAFRARATAGGATAVAIESVVVTGPGGEQKLAAPAPVTIEVQE
jgi:general secretion pathway protein D